MNEAALTHMAFVFCLLFLYTHIAYHSFKLFSQIQRALPISSSSWLPLLTSDEYFDKRQPTILKVKVLLCFLTTNGWKLLDPHLPNAHTVAVAITNEDAA